MTLRAAVSFAALHLDDEGFFAAALADDFARHSGASEKRLADRDFGSFSICIAGEKNLVEFHGGADFAFELLDLNDVASLHTILFSTGLNHCVHEYFLL